ncbi:MAG: RNA polymerase sigma factor [Woeseiaceae bacterium]
MPAQPGYYADGPEALVVSLASKGDRDAFAELVRRRQSWIRNLLRRCCNDANLADDLSQQVFLQAWRKIRQLREAHKFGSWLKQMAINEWLQYVRKNDALRGATSDEVAVLSQQDQTSIGMDLDRALALLTEPVRLCIVLSYHERMSHPEIAKMTDIQLGTVKSHIRRGSERLRELLSAYDESATAEDTK